jgi:hypothetical protein
VLATADGDGKVNSSVYARPHMMEDGSLAFIMRDRLTLKNIQSNPHIFSFHITLLHHGFVVVGLPYTSRDKCVRMK